MPLKQLDHVNIRTNNLAEMVRWYSEVLGLHSGPRPDFPFGGAWMYLGDQPVVHLVEILVLFLSLSLGARALSVFQIPFVP